MLDILNLNKIKVLLVFTIQMHFAACFFCKPGEPDVLQHQLSTKKTEKGISREMMNKCVDMKQGTKHPLKQQRYKGIILYSALKPDIITK